MSKLNKPSASLGRTGRATSPVRSESTATGHTYEGGAGYARDAKSELFLLAVSSFFGEDKFYEDAHTGKSRFVNLVRETTRADADWTARFLRWLRSEANIRTAAIVGAAEYAAVPIAERAQPWFSTRQVVDSVLQRADEPGEFVAYWREVLGKKVMPAGVQRGVADAVIRLYTERSFLKWDSQRAGYRFADVVRLARPGDRASASQKLLPWQRELFGYIVARSKDPATPLPEALLTLAKNRHVRELDDARAWLDPTVLRDAGMTWEDALSAVGSKVSKAELWSVLLPTMGYMAILRNLRNLDEAGISDELAEATGRLLAEPNAVAQSRQLPLRFLSAYRAAPSLRWAPYLEKALQLSLTNIPELPGRTLILVDTSSSMNAAFSKDGKVKRCDAAVIFALALAARCATPEVVSFSSTAYYVNQSRGANTKTFTPRRGEALLRGVDRWEKEGYFLGGGTDTAAALRKHYKDHDRVVILTDEQANSDHIEVGKSMRADRPLYTFNLAGYARGHAPSGGRNRHTFGGLTDRAFGAIGLIEAGQDARWPWEN